KILDRRSLFFVEVVARHQAVHLVDGMRAASPVVQLRDLRRVQRPVKNQRLLQATLEGRGRIVWNAAETVAASAADRISHRSVADGLAVNVELQGFAIERDRDE